MKFCDWSKWVKSLPFWKKWFVILIMIRPIVDVFHGYQIPAISLNPLEVVGGAVPLLIIFLVFTNQLPKVQTTKIDKIFYLWAVLVITNCIFMYLYQPSLKMLAVTFKISLPVYLFFYLKRFVSSSTDINGLLTTVLITSIVPACMVCYEIFAGPIFVGYSRGLQRIQGVYADAFNYQNYLFLSCLATGYFFLSKSVKISPSKKYILCVIVFVSSTITLLKVNHTASYGLFFVLIILFLLHNFREKSALNVIFLVVVFCSIYFVVKDELNQNVTRLTAGDMAVLAGKKPVDRAFHGRLGRWKRYMEKFDNNSFIQKIFGTSLEETPFVVAAVTGIHNDYFRILFQSGIFGLIFYLLFLFLIYQRGVYLVNAHKFLLTGALMIIALYSITMTPTLYATLLYIVLAIFAYVSLPRSILLRNE